MSELLKNIDARTKLAGTNKLEILMFTLGEDSESGRREVFGVNVFKVREVMRSPAITRAPEMPPGVEGMVSLRGKLVPVMDLAKFTGIHVAVKPEILIVTEYNGQTQGFLVEAVDTILRVDWSAMRVPPHLVAGKASGLVTAVTELANGQLVMMLDVEQLLAQTSDTDEDALIKAIHSTVPEGRTVLFADDSSVARKQISRTLDAMNVKHISTSNGAQAWAELNRIAENARMAGCEVRDTIQLVLTDVEMPEMDGYMLAKQIKSDVRFKGVPVIMHSSLSGHSNQQLGASVGIDEYVSKFEPAKLSAAISRLLA
ncbi:MAG TPA: chemotaxis protein [Burkholderiales bacterium]|jgi:two-component system chemotaxis response regulator CheV|nr:chemotaxis protein [Burkholderiales bacterium]